ncbi:MAG: Gfo/Idh/MocA family oxidoreductase [Pseudomonadota bacterium]|nr:Gfo/Idh/MocA family oxidoreductase [Pseudomonadota bacterium]
MKKLAVIGLGNISTRHRKNLKKLYPNSTVIAVSASGRSPKHQPLDSDILVDSISDLITHKPDMVIVASPATFHSQHAVPLIESGIPVLIEKPIAASLEEAQKINQAYQNYKTPVAIGYCLRYLPSSQKVNSVIQSKTIGKLHNILVEVGQYLPDWRANTNYKDSVSASSSLGGGALLELSHEIDYTQWIAGQLIPQTAILRSSAELNLDVEDSADILSINEDGAVISMHLDFLQRHPYRRCRFIGSEATLEWDLISNSVILYQADETRTLLNDPSWDKNQMYLNMILDFENMILNTPNNCISPVEAMSTLSFIEKVKELNTNRL